MARRKLESVSALVRSPATSRTGSPLVILQRLIVLETKGRLLSFGVRFAGEHDGDALGRRILGCAFRKVIDINRALFPGGEELGDFRRWIAGEGRNDLFLLLSVIGEDGFVNDLTRGFRAGREDRQEAEGEDRETAEE